MIDGVLLEDRNLVAYVHVPNDVTGAAPRAAVVKAPELKCSPAHHKAHLDFDTLFPDAARTRILGTHQPNLVLLILNAGIALNPISRTYYGHQPPRMPAHPTFTVPSFVSTWFAVRHKGGLPTFTIPHHYYHSSLLENLMVRRKGATITRGINVSFYLLPRRQSRRSLQ